MPTPIPTPTAEELVMMADIIIEPSDGLLELVSADSGQDISNAKWDATLLDMSSYTTLDGVASKGMRIKKVGAIEFQDTGNVNYSSARLDIRNRIRIRYGLSPLLNESGAVADSCALIQSLEWF